ncbi:MAG TPA: VOC family protein [Aquabacterium sp.]|nr:VOC family protein [Aquabacterium sp.]
MPTLLRLRQICLAAPRLAPVVDDLQAILGLKVCYRDPGVLRFGLENALMPVGTDFLEVVAPVRDDTAVTRFVRRTNGHGGYMAIFQSDDPRGGQARAAALGVRTAHEIDRPGLYINAQLHPRDCRAAFIELGDSPGGEDRRTGTWWPAGPDWQAGFCTEHTRRLLGIVLESPTPASLLAHWAAILDLPAAGDAPLMVDGVRIAAEAGPAEVMGAVELAVADVAATLERAVDRGLWVQGNSFHLAGVHFRLQHGD